MPLKAKGAKMSALVESKRQKIFLALPQWQSSGHRPLKPRWKFSLLATHPIRSLISQGGEPLGSRSLCPSWVFLIHQLFRAGVLALTIAGIWGSSTDTSIPKTTQ